MVDRREGTRLDSVAILTFYIGILRSFLKQLGGLLPPGTLQPGRISDYKGFGSVAVANRLLPNQMLPGRCGRVESVTKSCDPCRVCASGS